MGCIGTSDRPDVLVRLVLSGSGLACGLTTVQGS